MAPRVCSHCNKNLKPTNDPGVKCAGPCNKFFHTRCGKISQESIPNIKAGTFLWQCRYCRTDKKRNSFANENQSERDEEQDSSSQPDFQSQINLLQTTVENLKRELKDLSKKYTELTTSVQFHSDEAEELKSKITSLESLHGKADLNDKQIKLMEKNVDECDEKIDIIDFNHHRNEVEISGIPEMNSENLPEVLNTIGQQLKLGEIRDTIINAERLGTSNEKKSK
jgi:chromosome segregation ATPase